MAGLVSHTVVHGDDVQAVEQLPLVLVDPLHVHVKHGGRVDFHPVLLLQVLSEFHLVILRENRSYVTSYQQVRPVQTCSDFKTGKMQ